MDLRAIIVNVAKRDYIEHDESGTEAGIGLMPLVGVLWAKQLDVSQATLRVKGRPLEFDFLFMGIWVWALCKIWDNLKVHKYV